MPILSFFAWLCWFKVTNLRLVELTGMQGFGIGSLRLSWASIIGAWNSPIIVPYWAKINILIGFVLIVWILSPLGFYTNFLELHFSPIRTIAIVRSKGYFDNFHEYIDQPKFLFNETKYKLYVEKYGEHRFSVALLLHFGLTLALITSLMVHTILYHGHDIVKQAHTSLSNRSNDIHCFLMSLYPETPEWWFTIVFLLSLLSGILACQYGQLMEWYHVLLGVAVSWVLILPYGIIRATTGLNVINDTIPLLVGSLISHHEPIKILTLRLYFWYLRYVPLIMLTGHAQRQLLIWKKPLYGHRQVKTLLQVKRKGLDILENPRERRNHYTYQKVETTTGVETLQPEGSILTLSGPKNFGFFIFDLSIIYF
jgi:hypothetical protein